MHRAARPDASVLLLAGGTLFLGSALLFTVQPFMGRLVLPLAGGAPAVWTTCLMFFQAALLGGYLYAHVTTRWLPLGVQQGLHCALLVTSVVALPVSVNPSWGAPDPSHPIPWLLSRLVASAGLPFVALAANAPLVQRWFAMTRHPSASDPFFLYAASNLGSLVGLFAYPFVIEPRWSLAAQGRGWAVVYGALIAMTCGLIVIVRAAHARDPSTSDVRASGRPAGGLSAGQAARWLTLAFVPSLLLVSVTTHISTDVAAVPLLWVLPLAVYLITFVLTFARHSLLSHRLMTSLLPVAVIPPTVMLTHGATSPLVAIGIHLAALFVAGMVCHGELVRRRPPATQLTSFYTWIAAGGGAGGIFASLVAPVIFRVPLEYPLAIVLACLCRSAPDPTPPRRALFDVGAPVAVAVLLMVQMAVARQVGLASAAPFTIGIVFLPAIVVCGLIWNRPRPFAAGLALVLLAAVAWHRVNTRFEHVERNFFGVQSIELSSTGRLRALVHGNTIHGTQALDPARRREPTSYYTREGPAGEALGLLSQPNARSAQQIGVVGLGAGTLASYATPGQIWTFFEINPAVHRLARDSRYFTYLSDCGEACHVIVGDARLTLGGAGDGHYDALVLDAFSSDAIPVHLLTREALQLYLRVLAPRGIVLYHLSNRFLDLRPVVANLAADAKLIGFSRTDTLTSSAPRGDRFDSVWAVLAREPDHLGALASNPEWTPLDPARAQRVWTDDYSNIFTVLRPPRLR